MANEAIYVFYSTSHTKANRNLSISFVTLHKVFLLNNYKKFCFSRMNSNQQGQKIKIDFFIVFEFT
jgi:hypothetical protein